ncbi:hypothetical protein [Sandaracinus amylolyticus]|uniref:Lipoprotein n=1 Tax=Sandaracinus amylolyticus TaxID=927083 RepID=A0A0F6SHB9_9BACT|nr:hypothetical protein [Sandaracinus amylolyticus]AKF10174.1 hypothetical protein DB32_007323 [Sandaracinus amylolyticus]
MRRIPSKLLSLALVLGLAGCGATTELTPAGKADRVVGAPDAAWAEAAGVRWIVQGDAWTGRDQIARVLTPVRVRIENVGPRPILIRHGHFALTDTSMRRYLTVAPYRAPDAMPQPIPVAREIDAEGFEPSPTFDAFYTAPESEAAAVWQDVQLPVEEMRRRELPEGLLRPGGFVDGFLFFQHVPADAGRILFRADVTSHDGRRLGTALVPLAASD